MISSSRIRQKSRLRAGYNSDLYTLSNELVKRDTRIRKQEEPGRIYRNVLKRLKSRIARVAARWWIIHRDEEGGGRDRSFWGQITRRGARQSSPELSSLVRVSTRAWLASFFSSRGTLLLFRNCWLLRLNFHSDQPRFDVSSKSKGFRHSLESLACASFVDRGFSSVLYVSQSVSSGFNARECMARQL